MKTIIVQNYEEMSRRLAEMVADVVTCSAHPVLGLATGSTPLGAYKLLADYFAQKRLSFRHVSTVNLDEYVGLGAEDEQSYVSFMQRHLFNLVDVQPQNTHIPNGLAENLEEECLRYRELLQHNVQDLQILGLGSNGHIGFNEPFTPFDQLTHLVELSESTIFDNARFFDDVREVPTKAITMGIAEIMRAKKIVVVASGINKAQAVFNMLGTVSERCPASVLQTHPDCTLIVDKLAATLIIDNKN